MRQILLIREIITSYFKRHEAAILFALKLLVGIFVFALIKNISNALPSFDAAVNQKYSIQYMLLSGVLFAVLPLNLGYILIIFGIFIQLSATMEVAVLVTLLLTLVVLFYTRLAPRESMLIVITYLAFYFKLQYAIPIIAGLYFGLTSIVPITIGVFIWESVSLINRLMASFQTAGLDFMEMPKTFMELYLQAIELTSQNFNGVLIASVFAVVVIIVFSISKFPINYAKELSAVIGAVVNIIGFTIVKYTTGFEINMINVALLTIFSLALSLLACFFDVMLDYKNTETVRFEDEQNYYYVKIIPKLLSENFLDEGQQQNEQYVDE